MGNVGAQGSTGVGPSGTSSSTTIVTDGGTGSSGSNGAGELNPHVPTSSAQGDTPTTLVAAGAGSVEVFVNGMRIGVSARDRALTLAAALRAGERNVIALRARRQAGDTTGVHVQLTGPFGTVGTNSQWRAKAARATERDDAGGPWAEPSFADAAWEQATDLAGAAPAGFPADGPARGVWTSRPSDDVILLRLTLYVPSPASYRTPQGFGHAVTGGAGGQVVRVTSPRALAQALSGSTPRIVEVVGALDFRGSEGTASEQVCYQMKCPAPLESELRAARQGGDCSGKSTFRYTYDAAGTKPIAVGSNKTILGVGPDAAIVGKGLSLRGSASNVIIQNLAIRDINPELVWGGDALTLDGADRVWVDHVRFSRVGRQMLVTGFGKASNVTLSWNEFDGVTPYAAFCDGRHYWVWLLLGASDTITLANNWVHHTSGRAPHAGGMNNATVTAHIVNNLFDQVKGHAADPDTSLTRLFLEANYFRNVDRPIDADPAAPGNIFAPIGSSSAAAQSRCQQALGRACESNVAVPQSGRFSSNAGALSAFDQVDRAAVVTPYPADEVPYVVPHLAGPGHLPSEPN